MLLAEEPRSWLDLSVKNLRFSIDVQAFGDASHNTSGFARARYPPPSVLRTSTSGSPPKNAKKLAFYIRSEDFVFLFMLSLRRSSGLRLRFRSGKVSPSVGASHIDFRFAT